MKQSKTVRRTAWLLFFLICLQSFAGAVAYGDTDTLPEDRQQALSMMYELNIMRGSDGQFRPNDYLTRQEMFRIMYSISVGGETEPPSGYYAEKLLASGVYTDLDLISAWALPYAGYNVFNKIFIGNDRGELNPLGRLSYVDCAATLLRALGLPEAELNGTQYAVKALKYGLESGILYGIYMENISDPVTRADAALMIYNALNARCIEGISGGRLHRADVTGLQRYFRVTGPDDMVRSGVVTGHTADGGRDWLVVAGAEEEFLYPFDEALYARYFGRPVQWNVRYDGEILVPMTLQDGASEYAATIGEISSFYTENGMLYVYFGGQRVDFPAASLSDSAVFLCDTADGSVWQKSDVENVVDLIEYVRTEYGERYGADTSAVLSMSDGYIVLRVSPKQYLRFDRSALTGEGGRYVYRLNGELYAADDVFSALPDGMVLSVLRDEAGKRLTLLSVLQPVTVDSGALQAEEMEDGTIRFTLNGEPVRNRTNLYLPISDAALAERYGNVAKRGMTRYVLVDGDSLIAAGEYADYRLPYTDRAAYMLVGRTEQVTIGGVDYTALYGYINGRYGCELIDEDFGVPSLDGQCLLRLTTDTNSRGETVVRPYVVAGTVPEETDWTGVGRIDRAIYPSDEGRTLTVAGRTLVLSDDCAVACAGNDGTVGGYGLDDLLILDGKGYEESRGFDFTAVYGKDESGSVCWLMIIRTPTKTDA